MLLKFTSPMDIHEHHMKMEQYMEVVFDCEPFSSVWERILVLAGALSSLNP